MNQSEPLEKLQQTHELLEVRRKDKLLEALLCLQGVCDNIACYNGRALASALTCVSILVSPYEFYYSFPYTFIKLKGGGYLETISQADGLSEINYQLEKSLQKRKLKWKAVIYEDGIDNSLHKLTLTPIPYLERDDKLVDVMSI